MKTKMMGTSSPVVSVPEDETAAVGTSSQRVPALTLDNLWLGVALLPVVSLVWLRPVAGADLWWHLAYGRDIWRSGNVPTVDTYSYIQTGTPFFDQGWLAQLLMYGLERAGGVPLVVFAFGLVVGAAYLMIARTCWLRSPNPRLMAAVLAVVSLTSVSNWSARPQALVFPLFAGYLLILDGTRRDPRSDHRAALWGLPLMMVLWVNMHGSFVLGLVLILLAFAGQLVGAARTGMEPDDRQRVVGLLAVLVATGIATLVNPRGWHVYGYVIELTRNPNIRELVTEWAPTNFGNPTGKVFFLLVAAMIALLAYGRRRPTVTDVVVVGAFFLLALTAVRNVVWFGMVSAPFLVEQLTSVWSPRSRGVGSVALNRALVVVGSIMILLCLPWMRSGVLTGGGSSLTMPVAPDAIAEQLIDEPSERLFNSTTYGAFLMWAVPSQKVFMDPRFELYTESQFRDYVALHQGLDVDAIIDRYDFDAMLLDRLEAERLIEVLADRDDWSVVSEDPEGVYLRRSSDRA